MRESVQPLPIDSLIPAIKSSLQKTPNLIIEAAPGAGKTTRVPPALLDPTISQNQEIWVLEPRRIAARLSAHRVAEEMGEKIGETVGYQVRFEEISSPRTRLRFLTEGVLTRRLLSNPNLENVSTVILDEFHERHLQTDLSLALLRRLQKTTRPDLKLVVMSATLETSSLAKYLGDCPVLKSEGRQFEIAIDFIRSEDSRPLPIQVASAIHQLIAKKIDGDILVFLPGASEIRRSIEACSEIAAKENLLLTMLHGELSTNEQNRALNPSSQRKVILSTNVAETSITIDGIGAVIDSGLARIAEHSQWSGLPTLPIQRISKASAIQRAGRAGRTRAGYCLRLYPEMDFRMRREFETPEIQRLDLVGAALELHAAGINNLKEFDWFESPDIQAIESAESLLQKLQAINFKNELTLVGARMLRFPLHPRQSRLLIEAESRGIANRGALMAVLINERDLRSRNFSGPSRKKSDANHDSDLAERDSLFREAQVLNFDDEKLLANSINPGVAKAIARTYNQIARQIGEKETDNQLGAQTDREIRHAILAGYPDRVAKLQESDNESSIRGNLNSAHASQTYKLCNGSFAQLSSESVVRDSKYIVAIEADEKQSNRSLLTTIRTAVAIEPDWLLDLHSDSVSETNRVIWNEAQERAEIVSQLRYEELILDESKLDTKNLSSNLREAVSQTLIEAVRKQGWQHFLPEEDLQRLQARIDFVQRLFSESSFPNLDDSLIYQVFADLCKGKLSFREIRQNVNMDSFLHQFLSYQQITSLNQNAPERIQLAGRKNVKVHYEIGQSPWIASRLQDFFGMNSSPKIADGRASLVLHLLAPNQRPVQITQDLAGFWERHYPQIRKELYRRYPKHSWPENPK